jgi:hypothetical protein
LRFFNNSSKRRRPAANTAAVNDRDKLAPLQGSYGVEIPATPESMTGGIALRHLRASRDVNISIQSDLLVMQGSPNA